MPRIFTIGHSNRQWNDFISLLQDNHVDIVVDVRRYPGSKVCPQFNKEEMAKGLKKQNIEYINIEKLGGRRKEIATERPRCNYNSGWKNNSFRAYADYMTTTPFKEGINEILSLMTHYNTLAVMCAEYYSKRCCFIYEEKDGLGVFFILVRCAYEEFKSNLIEKNPQ